MEDSKVVKMWEQYENGTSYQSSINLENEVNDSVNFYEGRQWKPVKSDAQSKMFPRTTTNYIKMICRNKKANIINSPVNLVYKSETGTEEAQKFTRFAEYIMKEMEMERLNSDALGMGIVKGTYILHFYFDSDTDSLKCEKVDPLNCIVSDPTNTKEQEADFIIFSSRRTIADVKELADKGVDKELIVADELDTKYTIDEEQEGSNLCTLLTKYFRKNGEVYFERAVKGTIVTKERTLTPNLQKAMEALGEEAAEIDNKAYKCKLYPIVIASYEARDRCIYGISEVYPLIANQKAINFNMGLWLKSVQDSANGTWVVKKDALAGQTIKSGTNQVVVDNSKLGNGINRVTNTPISSVPLQIIENLASMTRTVSGSTEVLSGESISASMSGAAIAQLQAQANLPIKELRDRYYRALEREGKIIAMFFKAFYRDNMAKQFYYTEPIKNEQGEEEDKIKEDKFNGAEYDGMEFKVNVEATAGANASVAGDIGALESLFSKGAIDAPTYIKYYPSDALMDKKALVKAVEDQQNSQMAQMTATVQQMQAQLEQATQLITKQAEVVDNIMPTITANNQLKADLAQLQAEYTAKLGQVQGQMGEMLTDAQTMAQEISQTQPNNAMNSEKI